MTRSRPCDAPTAVKTDSRPSLGRQAWNDLRRLTERIDGYFHSIRVAVRHMSHDDDPEDEDSSAVDEALADARRAEQRADARAADADARVADADARIVDADAQTRHAMTAMDAAISHMSAAEAHMRDADQRATDADHLMLRADAHIERAAKALASAKDDSAEYQRALYHYTQLVRHRMANPLQAIYGLAQTLEEHPDLPRDRRLEMIATIREQAQALERVSLDPDNLDEAERELHPRPFE